MKQEILKLKQAIQLIVAKEREKGSKMFFDVPDRWYDNPKYRCINGHVRNGFVKQQLRENGCEECLSPFVMTFPEDEDGPLKELV